MKTIITISLLLLSVQPVSANPIDKLKQMYHKQILCGELEYIDQQLSESQKAVDAQVNAGHESSPDSNSREEAWVFRKAGILQKLKKRNIKCD